jgi:hypothetical protein
MTEYYVSNSGNNGNPGSLGEPFRTITHGVSALHEGDILYLRHGTYLEQVNIANKKNIVIRSYPGEHACIDGSLEEFRMVNSGKWELASLSDPDAHPEEYISTGTFPKAPNDPVNRGAFLDYLPYTRLITYMNLNDLRLPNETFEQITDFPDEYSREGPELIVDECGANPGPECVYALGDKRYKPAPYRYPWVYMGPGLWFDRDTHKAHIRLSHTHNNVPGVGDYLGEIDPNQVRLAISSKRMKAISISKSENLRLEDLSIRFGGDETMILSNCKNVIFDHVRFCAARTGVNLAGNAAGPVSGTVFQHCEFDGGLPTWYFRTDRKVRYFFVQDGKVIENRPGGGTLDLLLFGNPTNTGTRIHHCEFHDAHDVYLHGADLEFHHNWIHNINDEGLFLDDGTPQQPQSYDMKIFQNVITKTQSAISFAGNNSKGHWYIYRNLVDLRAPTAGFRPHRPGDTDVWRFGQAFKISSDDGDRDVFQNTFLVYDQQQVAYLHYRDTDPDGDHYRRTFNNIFIAVNPNSDSGKAITFIPSPGFRGDTDGNDYYRSGFVLNPLFRYLGYDFGGESYGAGSFPSLDAFRGAPMGIPPSKLFLQSQTQYPPGYEANSIAEDPAFCQFDPNGIPQPADDLRLKPSSPAIGRGVILPDELRDRDTLAPADPNTKPDIGCFPFDCCPLQVGVDGRRSYSSN